MVKKILTVLCLVALALSCIMLGHSLSGMSMPGCGAGSSCDSVMSGRWAYIGGLVPVSALSVGAYLAFLLCLLVKQNAARTDAEVVSCSYHEDFVSLASTAGKLMLLLCGAIAFMALWFTGLQAFVLHKLCKYCMAVHIAGLGVTVLTLMECKTELKRWLLFAVGVLAAAVVAAVQVATLSEAVYEEGTVQEPLPKFSAAEVPVVGSKEAPVQVELLFDYQCSHCRKLHAMLPQLVEMFNGQVAFLTLPTPLSNACNYYLPAGPDPFAGSCTLAKLALAVWQSAPESFPEFDAWLFEEGPDGWYPRSEADATEKASALIGADALASVFDGEWTQAYLTKVLELFGRTTNGKGGGIPRFVYAQNWLVPDADTPEALYGLLQEMISSRP